MTLIYGLFDRKNPELIMYVGKTERTLKQRLKEHRRVWASRMIKEWVKSTRIGIRLLQEVPTELWQPFEEWWVRHWREKNPAL